MSRLRESEVGFSQNGRWILFLHSLSIWAFFMKFLRTMKLLQSELAPITCNILHISLSGIS